MSEEVKQLSSPSLAGRTIDEQGVFDASVDRLDVAP
jgi:hypothetical protein